MMVKLSFSLAQIACAYLAFQPTNAKSLTEGSSSSVDDSYSPPKFFTSELYRHVPDEVYHHEDDISKFNVESASPPGILIGCPSLTFWVVATIGGERFRLIVDTGSTTLGVVGANCLTCADRYPQYVPSSTSQDMKYSVTALYGDQSGWQGEVFSDQVTVGGSPIVSMKFASIFSNSGFFNSSYMCDSPSSSNTHQGIIGFAFPSIALRSSSSQSTDSFFNILSSQKVLSENIFALQLCARTGKLWLGGYDSAYINGNILWLKVISQQWWVVQLVDTAVGGVSIGLDPTYYATTIIDSGSTNILLPTTAYNSIATQISSNAAFQKYFGGSNFFAGPNGISIAKSQVAALNAQLPTLSFSFTSDTGGTVSVTLSAISSYIREMDVGNTAYLYNGLQRVSDNSKTILGYSFMNQFIVIHETDPVARIGLGANINCGVIAGTSNTYAWDISDWSTCKCDGTAQIRYVQCLDAAGNIVSDSMCPQPKPISVKSTICTSATDVCQGSAGNGPTDPCANIACVHGKCQSGYCFCDQMWTGPRCEQYQTVNITSFASGSTLASKASLNWSYVGNPLPNVNVFLMAAHSFNSSFPSTWPQYIARQVSTTRKSYSWVWDNTTLCMGGKVQVGISFDDNSISLSPSFTLPDPCASLNCGSYGTCYMGSCQCAPGYTGTTCSTSACPNCNGHGTCDSTGTCVCTSGWTGSTCLTPVCSKAGLIYPNCDTPYFNRSLRIQNIDVSGFGLPLKTGTPPSYTFLAFKAALLSDLYTSLSLDASSYQSISIDSIVPDSSTSVVVNLLSKYNIDLTSLASSTSFQQGLVGGHVDKSYTPNSNGKDDNGLVSTEWIQDHWPYIAGAVGGALVVVFILYFACCRDNKKKSKNQDKYQNANVHMSQRQQQQQQQQVQPNAHHSPRPSTGAAPAPAPTHASKPSAQYNTNANLLAAPQGASSRSSMSMPSVHISRGSSSDMQDRHHHSPSPSTSSAPDSSGWGQYMSDKGVPYWFNTKTGDSTWVKPAHI